MSKVFTFKKNPRATGLMGVSEPQPSTIIKFKGKDVGLLRPPHWSEESRQWKINLRIVDETQHAGWKNVTLKARFDTEPDARAWLQEKAEVIISKYTLYALED